MKRVLVERLQARDHRRADRQDKERRERPPKQAGREESAEYERDQREIREVSERLDALPQMRHENERRDRLARDFERRDEKGLRMRRGWNCEQRANPIC